MNMFWTIFLGIIIIVAIYDVLQRKRTILHNFPVIGHFRYFLESLGPELRQYIVANNREELPFNRRQRSWVYASAKSENHYEGFGSDQDFYSAGYLFIKQSMMPLKVHDSEDTFFKCKSPKIIGPNREKPYRPQSIINISAMSFGSLSINAVTALNQGAQLAGCYHNTGEGGLAPYHKSGADVCFQFGTGYFGVRDESGNFSMEKMIALAEENPFVKMVEVKLSQGAKPGKGGVLPASKVTREIAEIRGLEPHKSVISSAYHTAFSNVPEMVDFIEEIAANTGLPVGIKAAIGKTEMWEELAQIMVSTGKGPDFITIDGGEGGTGAAPPSFADHVSLPFVYAFSDVYKIFQKHDLCHRITFIASGKLGFPERAIMAFAMGADMINIAREALMSIGCIQAQICHNNKCPTGIATNNKWLVSGLDPELKKVRFQNYIKVLTKEIMEITFACGYSHPAQFTMDDLNVSMGDNEKTLSLKNIYGYEKTPVEILD